MYFEMFSKFANWDLRVLQNVKRHFQNSLEFYEIWTSDIFIHIGISYFMTNLTYRDFGLEDSCIL